MVIWEYDDFDVEANEQSITEQLQEQFEQGWEINTIVPSQLTIAGNVVGVAMWRVILKRPTTKHPDWRQLKETYHGQKN